MGAEKRRRKAAAKAKADAQVDAEKKVEAGRTVDSSRDDQAVVPSRFAVSSNWKSLLERRPTIAPKTAAQLGPTSHDGGAASNVVALDCEMVGVGPGGTRSVLARLSIVDHEGKVLIDAFVRPKERITDYRTHITGITAATLHGPKVLREEIARKRAAELLDGKVVVGHAVEHDFQALLLSHPQASVRDTALYKPLRIPGSEKKTPSLARLVEFWLHETIRQDGKHDSVEDACMALRLYWLKSKLWERTLRKEAANALWELDEDGADSGPTSGAENIARGSRSRKRKRQAVQLQRSAVNPVGSARAGGDVSRKRKKKKAAVVAADAIPQAPPRKRRKTQA